MKKRLFATILCGTIAITSLVGCGTKISKESRFDLIETEMKVGMVTDSGTIDDKSYNQGAWEGVSGAVKNCKYVKPTDETASSYVQSITNLYDADYKFIVAPGFKFENAIYEVQDKFPDAKFVLIDGIPNDGNDNYKVGDNTVSIFFAEHEAGFMAAIATAVELQEGEVAFLGGMEVPAVQKYNWGFQQGITYANENLGTNITLDSNKIIYQGTFTDVAAGQQISSQWYDSGVDVIFAAAGGVGVGAITEAKARALKGEDVHVIGVDVDQYQDGIYNDNGDSVFLTSAMKYLGESAYNSILAEVNGEFPGGKTLEFNVANDGVGIPSNNPNLSEETMAVVESVREQIKNGEIVVLGTNNGEFVR